MFQGLFTHDTCQASCVASLCMGNAQRLTSKKRRRQRMTAHFGAARILTPVHLHFPPRFHSKQQYSNRTSFMAYLHAVSASFRNCMVNNKSSVVSTMMIGSTFFVRLRTRRFAQNDYTSAVSLEFAVFSMDTCQER